MIERKPTLSAKLPHVYIDDVSVQAFEPDARPYRAWDTELREFNVLVAPSGAKVFSCTTREGPARVGTS